MILFILEVILMFFSICDAKESNLDISEMEKMLKISEKDSQFIEKIHLMESATYFYKDIKFTKRAHPIYGWISTKKNQICIDSINCIFIDSINTPLRDSILNLFSGIPKGLYFNRWMQISQPKIIINYNGDLVICEGCFFNLPLIRRNENISHKRKILNNIQRVYIIFKGILPFSNIQSVTVHFDSLQQK